MSIGMIILWAISLFLFIGVPLLVIIKAESIYNFTFKFWKKFIDDESKEMIEQNKHKFTTFIKIIGGFFLIYMGLRVGFAFM